MLTFLRKIRKSLIETGSARRYLVYAIGEIALVVIGILIALQINNWNEWRKDQIRLNNHLSELMNELNNDRENLSFIISNVRNIEKYTFKISQFIHAPLSNLDTAQLIQAIIEAEPYAFFSISKAAYTNLIGSGDVKLVKNSELKNLLSIYHDNTNWDWTAHNGNLKNVIEQYASYVHTHLPPLLFRNHYIQIFAKNLKDEQFNSYNTVQGISWEELKEDEQFSMIISQLISYRVFQLSFYNQLNQNISQIIALIQSEINQ